MLTQSQILADARALLQEASNTPLLRLDAHYDTIFEVALAHYSSNVQNRRVVHHTVSAAGFRFVLQGSGALAGFTGLSAWQDGAYVTAVYHPYNVAAQGNLPLDPQAWRVIEEPGLTVLELLTLSPSSGVLRIEFSSPHRVDAIPATVPTPSAPTAGLAGVAGALSAGTYQYAVVHRTANGTTIPSASASVVVVSPGSSGQVDVTMTPPAVEGVDFVDLYRTVANGSQLKFLATVASPPLETYRDNAADGALGADAPTTNTAGGLSSVRAAHERALALLVASYLAEAVAARYVQNTGTTSLPNDVVNRQSQASEMASRAKRLRELYGTLVGVPQGGATGQVGGVGAGTVAPASATVEFDYDPQHGRGMIFRRKR